MRALFVILLLSLCGCSLIDKAALSGGYQKKAKAEEAIAQTKREYDAKLAAKDREIADKEVLRIVADHAKNLYVAGRLYRIDLAFQLTPHPDRAHIIMDNNANEARVVLPPPSIEDMVAANAEIKRQLDETVTTLEALRAEHAAAIKQAEAIKGKMVETEAALVKAREEKEILKTERDNEVIKKQEALSVIDDDVIALEHQRGDDAKARHALLTKMSMGAGLLAVLCLAGAVWSPVFKGQFGLVSGVLAVAAVGIWYLTPVVVLSIAGVGGLAVAVWAALKHNTSTKTNTALVNAVQDIREKAPEVYAANVKPALTEWTTKYTKDEKGNTVTVPDKAVTANIDAALVSSNRV